MGIMPSVISSTTRRTFLSALPLAAGLRAQTPLYDVRSFEPSGGPANSSAGIQRAIDAAAEKGGGTVYVPAGRYVCGTIRLKSRISLWIDNGASLMMSPNDADFDAAEQLPYNPASDRATSRFRFGFLTGEDLDDVTIFGQGTIDGNRTRSGGPKPISLKRCRRVAIRDIAMRNAGSYNISLLGCEDVRISGVSIRNGFSDGIDPDCCKYVRISDCFVESVDDAICLKASPALGERVSTEHVTVENCVLRTASIHLKCGTESLGDFRNIAFSNCSLVGGMGDRHGNPGVALYSVDGGQLRGVTVSNITMQNVGIPIALRLGARGTGQPQPVPGILEDISFENIVATGARRPSVIAGIPEARIRGVHIGDLRVSLARAGAASADAAPIPEKAAAYPDPTMFGELPAYGFYLRHARRISLHQIRIESAAGERRPGIVTDDVEELDKVSVYAA